MLIDCVCWTTWAARHDAYQHLYTAFVFTVMALEVNDRGLWRVLSSMNLSSLSSLYISHVTPWRYHCETAEYLSTSFRVLFGEWGQGCMKEPQGNSWLWPCQHLRSNCEDLRQDGCATCKTTNCMTNAEQGKCPCSKCIEIPSSHHANTLHSPCKWWARDTFYSALCHVFHTARAI